jgi:lipoprotein-releasing system ATP-binding protein
VTDERAASPSNSTPAVIPPVVASPRGARIEVRKLGKAYIHNGQALPVLWDVDLSLAPGDMVACVGASGVGKSTFLQILGTLDLPTAGSIKFDGEELTTMSAGRLAEFRNRRIGFVFQFHHLLPEFTALENVMMPALIQASHNQAHKRPQISQPVSLCIATPAERALGGEQQRGARARDGAGRVLSPTSRRRLDRSTDGRSTSVPRAEPRARSTLLVVTHNPELAS